MSIRRCLRFQWTTGSKDASGGPSVSQTRRSPVFLEIKENKKKYLPLKLFIGESVGVASWETEVGGSQAQGQSGQQNEFKVTLDNSVRK